MFYYSDKTWVFDQSERAQGLIYCIKTMTTCNKPRNSAFRFEFKKRGDQMIKQLSYSVILKYEAEANN